MRETSDTAYLPRQPVKKKGPILSVHQLPTSLIRNISIFSESLKVLENQIELHREIRNKLFTVFRLAGYHSVKGTFESVF